MNDGRRRLGVSPKDAVKNFVAGEAGATVSIGLWLLLYYPEILKSHIIMLPGSRYYRGDVPYLADWIGGPRLRAVYADHANSLCGSASVGVSF